MAVLFLKAQKCKEPNCQLGTVEIYTADTYTVEYTQQWERPPLKTVDIFHEYDLNRKNLDVKEFILQYCFYWYKVQK